VTAGLAYSVQLDILDGIIRRRSYESTVSRLIREECELTNCNSRAHVVHPGEDVRRLRRREPDNGELSGKEPDRWGCSFEG
jgi:hypothetical protein